MKECNKCKRSLPANTDYYFKKKDTKDGFTNKCKECSGKKFTNKLTKIAKEGYKFCLKCDRELKANISYFPPDKGCKDGLRNLCRECGKDGHFMAEDYEPKTWWSKEDEDLLIEVYPHLLNEEIIDKYFPYESRKSLGDKIYRINKKRNLNIHKTQETMIRKHKLHSERISGENAPNYGKVFSEETREKISKARKGKYMGENSPLFGISKSDEHRRKLSVFRKNLGNWKGTRNPRHINPLNGEKNGRWQGGITSKNAKIRNSEEYANWRSLVFSRDDYTCQCCGSIRGQIEAHHIENFSSNEEKRFDIDNGITMCKDCHNPIIKGSFHHTYGTRSNSLHQLHEYMKNISWCTDTRKILKDKIKNN